MFQNLRTNSTLYILHKEDIPYIEYGSVANVSAPKPKYPTNHAFGQFPQMETVVDVVVTINGQSTNLQGLPAGLDIADFGHNGNIVVSSSKDAINNEVVLMKQKSNDILGSIDFHRNVIAACDKMLNILNPEVAEKQKQEQEIKDLRTQIQDMSRNMSSLMEWNKKLMEQLGVNSETANIGDKNDGNVDNNGRRPR